MRGILGSWGPAGVGSSRKSISKYGCPTSVIIGHTHHQKSNLKKMKGYCTTCAKNRKLTSWIPRCCIDRPTRRIPRLPTHGGRRGSRRLELPHRCADSCPRRAAPRAGIPPRLALAGGLRAMTANDLFSTACRDRARSRLARDALPCAALPPREACEELPSWCWTDFLYRSAAGAAGEIMGQG
jgi:hypothetical protein